MIFDPPTPYDTDADALRRYLLRLAELLNALEQRVETLENERS